MTREAGESLQPLRGKTPARALVISLGCLGTAGLTSLLWPTSLARYAGFVWLLAVVPVFLLSYYRGGRGAAAGVATAMAALTGFEVIVVRWMGHAVEWWMYGAIVGSLVVVAAGVGVVSELLHRQRRFAVRMAGQDPLTGLANRRALEEHTRRAISAAQRSGGRLAILFLDLVAFKRVNDRHGHAAGDEILRGIGQRLVGNLRGADLVARVGGDEFAILVSGLGGVDDAVAVARRVRHLLGRPFQVGGEALHVGARLGLAAYPDHALGFDELLSHADPFHFGPGKPGSGDIVIYDPALQAKVEAEMMLEEDLRRAIDEHRVFLHYQPILDIERGAIVGYEALARLDHPRLGLLSAARFVPLAERCGLSRRLEWRVVELAFARLLEWRRRRREEWLAVNLSAQSIEDPEFFDALHARLVSEQRLDPGQLVFEITERSAMRTPEEVARALERFRRLGVRIAIDDFGTGHSSLAYLSHLPADVLKLDAFFTAGLDSDPKRQRLVEGILGLADGLQMSVVAEGVERASQLAWLRARGCPLAQGYHTGAPTEAAALGRGDHAGALTRVGRAPSLSA